ncbi:MAG: hypothetical protein ACMG50_01665 [Thermomonas sp.]
MENDPTFSLCRLLGFVGPDSDQDYPTGVETIKVLACDGIHEDGLALFRDAGWDVPIFDPIKDPDALALALADVDADAVFVRNCTKITQDSLENVAHLMVIGRTHSLDTRPPTRLLVAPLLGVHSKCVTPVNALPEAAVRGGLGINIVNFALGAGGDCQARAAITVDRAVDDAQLQAWRAMPGVLSLAQV